MFLHVSGNVNEHPPAAGTGALQICDGENDSVALVRELREPFEHPPEDIGVRFSV